MTPIRSIRSVVRVLSTIAALYVVESCRDYQGPGSPTGAPDRSAPGFEVSPAPLPVTLVGAGNIASCKNTNDDATAALLDGIPGTVFALGDNAYDNGTLTQYNTCYNPNWGRHKTRTQPAVGDRDYKTTNAGGYFGYFGSAAGDPTKGYYSYELGAWHIVVLNSNSSKVPTAAGSAQEQWLRADLAAHPGRCTLAYWHHPRFSSKDSPNSAITPLWNALYAAGVDVVVNAHYAFYERFAPQTPAGAADAAFGIREFIAGTGGGETGSFGTVRANSEVRSSGTPGVLKLTLDADGYAWEFVPIAGKTFRDSGTGGCHGAPPLSVNAGADVTASPGDTVKLAVTLTDPANAPPWTYTILWGDGGSSNGTAQSSPIIASHVYSALGLDSVRVAVTSNVGGSGSDSLAVQVVVRPTSVVLVGAGDIADCTRNSDSLTANLLDGIPGTVFTAGDNAYPDASSSDYTNCYHPTWGRHKARTRPVPGNHEYSTSGATPYYSYFGAAAGDPTKGYYSYDLGDWHIIALNSNIAYGAGSAQEQWLRADLAASTKRCTLAYLHHPLFSSGTLAAAGTQVLWQDLYVAGAEIVVAGHEHNYQRFAPETPTGVADPVYGIREFIAGMGGAGHFSVGTALANTEVQEDQTYGVLKLTLYAARYDWAFVPVAGKTFTDSGNETCHDAPGAVNHAPIAAAGGPYAGVEGGAVSFIGSGSSDPDGDALTYAWSFGDGGTGSGVNPSHSYADNGSYTVTLAVTDARGASSSAATITATVANAAPSVNAGANQAIGVGASYTLGAGFSDPGTNDAPWAYSIDWGDGSSPTTGSTTSQSSAITATHPYPAAGSDTVRVTVTDKDGATGSGQLTVTVSDANQPPTATAGGPYAGTEGTAVSFDGSGSSDPDGDALTYAWSFGDGGTGSGVKPSHSYADNGAYSVTLTVTDARGASGSAATTTATIGNVAPSVNAGVNQTVTAGTSVTLDAAFSDPGANDAPWSYSIDWGDGSSPTTGGTSTQSSAITATHPYSAAGSNIVRVTVTDKDGATGSGQLTVTVTQPGTSVTLVGAGEVTRCDNTKDEATALLLDDIPGTVFTTGDNIRASGSLSDFTSCYDPSWGRHKARTRPSLGAYEYQTAGAAGYFDYFALAGGERDKGYYTYELGDWHIVVLNSNIDMTVGSPQEQWLRTDLAASTKRCTLAYWAHPRFSSYSTAVRSGVKPLWDDLYAAGAEVVLNGHYRLYERFAPQTPDEVADPQNGIRQFTVGTGGHGVDAFGTTPRPNSEVRISGTYGVLQLTLGDGVYSWQFVPVAGQTATDSGSGTCH
ncbi:MAG TPA: PKD domain-containing protein [Gemmatimonadales bacterium]|nr:PKD domain-containing protein [Gemmatimonadales bacterium]